MLANGGATPVLSAPFHSLYFVLTLTDNRKTHTHTHTHTYITHARYDDKDIAASCVDVMHGFVTICGLSATCSSNFVGSFSASLQPVFVVQR